MRRSFRSRVGVLLRSAAVAGLLAGCTMVGPDFTRPSSPVLDRWIEENAPGPDAATGLTTRSAPVVRWWETFRDPVLDGLVAEAYAQNLTLQMAGARVMQARAQLGIAHGELFPQSQAVGAAYSRRRISENLGPVQDVERFVPLDLTFATSEAAFDAQWELDVWGGQRRGVQAARANLAAEVANYDDALVTLVGDVAAVYINIRALQQTLGVTRANIALQTQGNDLTRNRFDEGVTTDLDVQESTALLNRTRAMVPMLESDLQQAKNALAVLLAQPPSRMTKLLGSSGPIPRAHGKVDVGIPAELLRRRPDIRAAELEAAAQSANVGVAISDLYPQFVLTGSIGTMASSGNDLFAASSVTSLASPGVVWNVLNYGRIQNNVRAQDAAFQGLVANYQNTVLAAYAEVENALVAYQKSRTQVGYLEAASEAARKAADIALSQYGDGVADYSRVLNTQEAALRIEAALVDARAQVSENLVALYKGLGGGWEIRAGREFLPDDVIAEMAYRTDWGDLLKEPARAAEPAPAAGAPG
ncbi:MAG: efflux transporter outer membrane subunit [Rhodobacteraceae bacterium]|nr:efflux transporter outer membrane subunit [Paracoccaceae bacterium]